MGRKIPGKKHRGVKDPFEQNARRNATLLKKINAPPSNPDEQDLPKSVERIMKLKQAVKDGAFSKKRKKRHGNVPAQRRLLPGLTRPEKSTPVFRRLPAESESHFVQRMEAECQEVIAEAKFEKEFDVSVQRDPGTGEVTGIAKREKIELDRIMEKYMKKDDNQETKNTKGKEDDRAGQTSQRLSKKERWKLKKKEKLQKSKEKEVDEFESFRDHVKFGEVVHAPPVLKAPRNASASTSRVETVPRPGKKNLLLTALLKPAAGGVSDLEKLRQEQRRASVVAAYRQLKSRS